MPQNRESGARANEYGRVTAQKIAEAIGATRLIRNSNEFDLSGRHITIRCARSTTTRFGVTYQMLERVDAVFGAMEQEDGTYELYELSPRDYEKHMTETKSKGASAGKVGMVGTKVFVDKGKHFRTVRI